MTLIWNDSGDITILSEIGQESKSINNTDAIIPPIPKDLTVNDVEITISDARNSGESKFHISCSDQEVNGAEDCGNDADNEKDNNYGFLNDWIFAGITGEKGQFTCKGIPGAGGSAEVGYGFRVENFNNEEI